ncbi:mechanosensitive ion channel [Crocinitomix catalasitica]|nr:mechanosensitive ion channel [Crocinitomix catalasitica]
MWEQIYNIINYPIISGTPILVQVGDEWVEEPGFIFSPLNILIFLAIYLIAKIFIKYLRKSFNIVPFTKKALKTEGRPIAVWKLCKQIIYVVVLFLCIISLQINNAHINYDQILEYRFVEAGAQFHIAVYHLFLIIIVIFVSRLTVSILKLYIHRTVSKREKLDEGTEYIYIQLAKYFIYSVAILSVIRSFGADMELFIGALTVLGVGFALGVQYIFKDYTSGILLLFEGHVKVGDIIEIQNINDEENFVCQIQKINLRSTTVETRDNKMLIIPNSQLTHEKVINWSLGSQVTRFIIPVTVKYGSDLELVKKILLKCATDHPKIAKTREPMVRLVHFGDHGLEMDVLFWANQNLFIDIHKSDIRFEIDKEFRKHGVEIPFPQMDVHLDDASKEALKGRKE